MSEFGKLTEASLELFLYTLDCRFVSHIQLHKSLNNIVRREFDLKRCATETNLEYTLPR